MPEVYRWNAADYAVNYDAAAEIIHPHYLELQETILDKIARPRGDDFLLVDLGGGSGRLAEKFLARFPHAKAVVVDQSEAFLAIAERRIERFAGRSSCLVAKLQDDWRSKLPEPAGLIVSMSAIHHLFPEEKQQVYAQAFAALETGGQFMNGDEIRDPEDSRHLAAMETWAAHMRQIVATGQVSEATRPMLEKWQERNVTCYGQPRTSGDDIHETVDTQLGYLRGCGFRNVDATWQKDMWALLEGTK